jgi:multidrug efflux pump subunit AcrB
VEVTARHTLTSQAVVDGFARYRDLGCRRTRLKLGGEIEESEKANAGLNTYAPFALVGMLLLFLWQFGSLRKALIVIASMPFVVIGATLGLTVTGQPLSFSATIGILALMGIIVNNAVLLLGRIAEDREAGMELFPAIAHAAEMRLRPIVMTKLVCISGTGAALPVRRRSVAADGGRHDGRSGPRNADHAGPDPCPLRHRLPEARGRSRPGGRLTLLTAGDKI